MLHEENAAVVPKHLEGHMKMATVNVMVFGAASLTVSDKKMENVLVWKPHQAPTHL